MLAILSFTLGCTVMGIYKTIQFDKIIKNDSTAQYLIDELQDFINKFQTDMNEAQTGAAK